MNMSREELFRFPIKWQNSLNKVDKDFIFTTLERDKFPNFPESYVVQKFNLNDLLFIYCGSSEQAEELYSTNQLWDTKSYRNNRKTTKLVDYILNKNSLCPPIIDFTNKTHNEEGLILFFDGNHRVALCRYLGMVEIPFIIKKSSALILRVRISNLY